MNYAMPLSSKNISLKARYHNIYQYAAIHVTTSDDQYVHYVHV